MSVLECKFFGVRADRLEHSPMCKKCKRLVKDLYNKCTKETQLEDSISITIRNGETIRVQGPLPAFHSGECEVEGVRIDRFSVEKKKPEREVKKEQKSERLPRVPGVIEYCLKLIGQNENPTVIEALLAERYTKAGYPQRKATTRAHNIYLGQLREKKRN